MRRRWGNGWEARDEAPLWQPEALEGRVGYDWMVTWGLNQQQCGKPILLAISSTEWGGLGCLFSTILWELVALNGVGHTIL